MPAPDPDDSPNSDTSIDSSYHIRIGDDRVPWQTIGGGGTYDAIHTIAGALLAGADRVEVRRGEGEGDTDE